ncbi:MAG: CDP-diacylglycerol--glycerol-3-phosphate 3-phosphatidyltransferase [Clostridia bacterium]|nr:CDP-diacylglycerol--glycerol-3-phosphate 3-phosphatidyltransferase [Clostridia bacterium]
MNLPNKISIVRICMIPVFVLFFFLDIPYNYLISAVVFMLAAFTDALDGHIARSRNLVTNLGKFLDPIADKVLVATAFVLMVVNPFIFGLFGAWGIIVGAVCICLILARELIISAFRQIAATAGIVLAAEKLGKYKTAFQDACVVVLLVSASLTGKAQEIVNIVGLVLFAIAVVLTVISGVSYVVKNKQVLKDTQK